MAILSSHHPMSRKARTQTHRIETRSYFACCAVSLQFAKPSSSSSPHQLCVRSRMYAFQWLAVAAMTLLSIQPAALEMFTTNKRCLRQTQNYMCNLLFSNILTTRDVRYAIHRNAKLVQTEAFFHVRLRIAIRQWPGQLVTVQTFSGLH